MTPRGPLIVLSGPSGVGKTTVVDALLHDNTLPLRRGITATSRQPRHGEVDGVDYYFWTVDRFKNAIDSGEMLEHAIVHGTDYYGIPRSEVDSHRDNGVGVVLVIDVQGADHVRAAYANDHLSIFLTVTPPNELRRRLEARGEASDRIARRLATATDELKRIGEFDHVVTNTDLATAVRDLTAIIRPLFGPDKE